MLRFDNVPTTPGKWQGYHHTEGEIHITSSNEWVSCSGIFVPLYSRFEAKIDLSSVDQDSEDPECTLGYVPHFYASSGDVNFHMGMVPSNNSIIETFTKP